MEGKPRHLMVLAAGAALAGLAVASGPGALGRRHVAPEEIVHRNHHRRSGHGGRPKAGGYKGSKWARRATRRGGNPARSGRARLVRHHFSINARRCTMCGLGMSQASSAGRRWYCPPAPTGAGWGRR